MTSRPFRGLSGTGFGFPGALALAALLTLPLACDDDGTSPPDPGLDKLPDTVPSGTYEVGDLHLPAGASRAIAGEVVILSSGSVRLDGRLLLLPGSGLVIAATDSLIIAGSIVPDTLAPASTTASSRLSGRKLAGATAFSGNVIRVTEAATLDGMGNTHFAATGSDGVVEILTRMWARHGRDAESSLEDGEHGADIAIGNPAAIASLASIGVTATRPALIRIGPSGMLRGGDGGYGFDDQEGTLSNSTLVARGTAGGRGGSVYAYAAEIRIEGGAYGGRGGEGGWCGAGDNSIAADEPVPLRAPDATVDGESGIGIDCTTGVGGDGGSVEIVADLIVGNDNAIGGVSGGRGGLFARAGNGAAGGNGGSIIARFEGPGTFGRPLSGAPPTDPYIRIGPGGIGGASNAPGVPGGSGGSITILTTGGDPVPHYRFLLERPLSNGGAGFSGCLASPFAPGSAGGRGGMLTVAGAEPPEYEGDGDAFAGGAGSDGLEPGPGGSGGYDDAGNRLGPDGSEGLACNPTATVVASDPAQFSLGDDPTTVSLTGTDFAPGNCTARMNGEPLETECTSATEATTIVPVANQKAGPAEFCMENGPPGGGLGEECAAATILNREPVVISLGENVVIVGEATDLVVNADYVVSGTVVLLDDAPQPTTVNGPTEAVAHIAASEISSTGERQVSLLTPDGVQSTSSLTLTVNNPVPAISSLEPSGALVNSPSLTVSVHGAGFVAGSQVFWTGTIPLTTVWSGPSLLLVDVPASLLAAEGEFSITVQSAPPGGGQSGATFSVIDPVPVLTGIDPDGAEWGSPEFTLGVTGSNFSFNVWVLWGDVRLLATVVSREFVQVSIPAEYLTTIGEVPIRVANGAYTLDGVDYFVEFISTDSRPFTIRAPLGNPFITSVSPSTLLVGSDESVTVNGGNFAQDLSTILFDGEPRATTFVSDAQLTTVVLASELSATGSHEVTVSTEGVGTSEPAILSVENPAPVIADLSQREAFVGGPEFELWIIGSRFVEGVSAVWDGFYELSVVYFHPEQLRVMVPAALTAIEQELLITVTNPAPGGGQAAYPFVVVDPYPAIVELAPNSEVEGSPEFEMTIHGSRFDLEYARAWWVNADGTLELDITGRVGDEEISVMVPSSLVASAEVDGVVHVTNPHYDPYPGPVPGEDFESNSLPFDVLPGVDPCTVIESLEYGETATIELGPDGCIVEYGGSSWEYIARFEVTTTQQASAVRIAADDGAYVILTSGGVELPAVFSGESAPRQVFAASGMIQGKVSSGSGTPDATTTEISVSPTDQTDIGSCSSNPPLIRPTEAETIELGVQAVESTDCFFFPPTGGTFRGDAASLAVGAGETVRITMESSEFPPAVFLRCNGPDCTEDVYAGTGSANRSTLEVTIPQADVDGGSVFTIWLASDDGTFGAYSATLELNPEAPPACTPTVLGLGATESGSLTSSDCAGSVANQYYDVWGVSGTLESGVFAQEITVTSASGVAVRQGPPGDFDRPHAVYGAIGTNVTRVFTGAPEAELFVYRVLSNPDQTIDYSVHVSQVPEADWQNTGCAIVWLTPTMSTTQQLDTSDCLRNGKHEEQYFVWVLAGQTLQGEVVSSDFDAYVELFDSEGELLTFDDNGGGGTNARATYTAPNDMMVCVTVREAGAGTTGGQHTTTVRF